MALEKIKEQASGVSGDYWKLRKVDLSPDRCICVVDLYKDAAARAANKQPLSTVEYTWSGDDNPCEVADMDPASKNPYQLCYDKLKTLAEFSGATDV